MAFQLPATQYGHGYLAFGDGVFLAGAYFSDVVTPIQGRAGGRPYLLTGPASLNFAAMAFGGGVFLFVENGIPHACLRSRDLGQTWAATPASTPSNATSALAYLDNVFVGVGAGSTLYRSINQGDSWSLIAPPSAGDYNVIAAGGGRFVALKKNSAVAIVSADRGATWAAKALPISGDWKGLAYGDGGFYGIDAGRNVVVSHDGGDTWEPAGGISGAGFTPNKMVFSDGLLLCNMLNYNATYGALSYSEDGGRSWSASFAPPAPLGTIAAGGGAILGVGGDVAYCLNEYLPQKFRDGGLAKSRKAVATIRPVAGVSCLRYSRREATPKLNRTGTMVHHKVFGAPRGLGLVGGHLKQLTGATAGTVQQARSPASGLPLAVGTDGALVEISDSGGVYGS